MIPFSSEAPWAGTWLLHLSEETGLVVGPVGYCIQEQSTACFRLIGCVGQLGGHFPF